MIEAQHIFDKYNKILQEHANKVMPSFESSMNQKREPYLTFYKKLFDFYLLTSYLTEAKLFPDDGSFQGLRIMYAKSCHSFFGIYSCLKNGLASEGGVILRSLFETKLNVQLVAKKNPLNNDKLFFEFHFAEKWNNLQAKRLLLKEAVISQEDFNSGYGHGEIERIESDYEKIKENYHPKNPHHWAWKLFTTKAQGKNPSIRMIAEDLGLSDDYVRVYGALSLASHGSPNLKNILTSSGRISTAPIFNELIFTVGCLSIGYLADIIIEICSFLQFEDKEDISIYINAFTLSTFKEYDKYKEGRVNL